MIRQWGGICRQDTDTTIDNIDYVYVVYIIYDTTLYTIYSTTIQDAEIGINTVSRTTCLY
jgi:hypothetical protein